MTRDEDSDDDAATMIGKTDAVRAALARPGVESATRKFDVGAISGPTKAMPSGYGIEELERTAQNDPGGPVGVPQPRPSLSSGLRHGGRSIPAARASIPRPAAGRPAVPSLLDDATSESEMTLIEAIDAELESITAELSIPEGTNSSLLEDLVSSSEMTVRMAVPDDLPSNLLDSTSEPGTQIQPPRAPAPPSIRDARGVPVPPLSLSSMPTPPRHTRTGALPIADVKAAPRAQPQPDAHPTASANASPAVSAPSARAAGQASAEPASADLVSAERPRGPAPKWVGRYLAACVVFSILGAAVLAYLKMQRFW